MNKPRIFIIEDDLVAAMTLEMILEDFDVIEKYISADDLLEEVKNKQPDLILLDVMLAGSKLGTEAAEELRKQYDTPILFTTALNDSKTRDQISNLSRTDVVNKPYLEEEILAKVKQLLGSL